MHQEVNASLNRKQLRGMKREIAFSRFSLLLIAPRWRCTEGHIWEVNICMHVCLRCISWKLDRFSGWRTKEPWESSKSKHSSCLVGWDTCKRAWHEDKESLMGLWIGGGRGRKGKVPSDFCGMLQFEGRSAPQLGFVQVTRQYSELGP